MDVYSTDEWRRRRRAFLKRHPTCVDCGSRATQPDHVPPRQLLVALGIHDPDDEQWLAARCGSCHSRVTRLRDMPLLKRWREGEASEVIAEAAMTWTPPQR